MSDIKHIEKFFTLFRLLTTSRYSVTLETACREMECDRSTFYRVKNELASVCDAEIVPDEKYGGYRFKGYDSSTHPFPGLCFKENELVALFCFEHLAEGLQEGFISEIVKPLTKKIDVLVKLHKIDAGNWKNSIKIIKIGSRKILPNVFKTVATAVLRRKKMRIEYKAAKDASVTDRTVSPQTLLCYRDNWYVDAKCHLRNDLRTFALSRISRIELLKTDAEHISQAELNTYYANSYGIFSGLAQNTAKIQFKGIAARVVEQEEWHPDQKKEKPEEGTLLLTIPYTKSDELIMDVLRWGEDAQVIEPESLRLEIMKKVEKMKENYGCRMD